MLYHVRMFTLRRMQCTAMLFSIQSLFKMAGHSIMPSWIFLQQIVGREGWRIGWITVHDADGAFAAAGVPDTLLKLCQAVPPKMDQIQWLPQFFHKFPPQFFERILGHAWVRLFMTSLFFTFLYVHLFIPFLCISTRQVSLGPSAPLQAGQRGEPWPGRFPRTVSLEAAMPEILTSVPNGCRWHKDVLAALEVHHVLHDSENHQEIHQTPVLLAIFGSFAMTSAFFLCFPSFVDAHPNFLRFHQDAHPHRCSRCRPVPSAVCNAVKASQAWRWLQNQKGPCNLEDEGREGHQWAL